tara:strand:- start:41910 stop:42605 length:696 start_codon:yes stop_codon:yes gene_type:complete
MDDNLFLIIMAFVAGFIILQLRRTLGRKDGYDGKDEKGSDSSLREKGAPRDNVIPIKGGLVQDDQPAEAPQATIDIGVTKSSPFYSTLEKINSYDRSFTLPTFIDGAEYAYGMILNAFWDGDIKTLRSFLSRDVFSQFEAAINDMKSAEQRFDNVLNDIEKIELEDASIDGSMAELTLKFNSHMTIAVKDVDGNVVDGDPEKVVPVLDIWTFCRDVRRGDPNWTLVSTSNE